MGVLVKVWVRVRTRVRARGLGVRVRLGARIRAPVGVAAVAVWGGGGGLPAVTGLNMAIHSVDRCSHGGGTGRHPKAPLVYGNCMSRGVSPDLDAHTWLQQCGRGVINILLLKIILCTSLGHSAGVGSMLVQYRACERGSYALVSCQGSHQILTGAQTPKLQKETHVPAMSSTPISIL